MTSTLPWVGAPLPDVLARPKCPNCLKPLRPVIERGRTVGYWVRSGTAVPFVSTEAVRVTGAGRRGGRGGR